MQQERPIVRRTWPGLIVMIAALTLQAQEQPNVDVDVAILATVHAKSLTFAQVPEVRVTFPGQPQNQTVWKSDRDNLPEPVQPHVIYRDIGIRLTISSTLPNIEQIVDDALREPSAPAPAPPPAAAKSKKKNAKFRR
jgi:hypothetical protein